MAASYDVIVVGGGIMGSSTAIQLAHHGMKVVVFEAAPGLCLEASGKNGGGLAIQIQKADMMPYALEATEMWKGKNEPFRFDLHFKQTGSLALAYTDDEVDLLRTRSQARIDQGAPIEFLPGNRIHDYEPKIGTDVKMATFCPLDGHVDPLATGHTFTRILRDLGADLRTSTRVEHIHHDSGRYEVEARGERFSAKRILVSAGAWVQTMLKEFGITTDLTLRINQMIVTERVPWTIRRYVTIAGGNLSIKQLDPGTIVIGGAWQGRGQLEPRWEDIDYNSFIGNLTLAAHVIPELKTARVVRNWTGFDIRNETFTPFIGRIPNHRHAFLLGGVFCGFHLGICLGALMGDVIADKPPKMPIPQGAIAEPIH